MDAHISRFLRYGSFENQRQMLKWMDLRIFPILRSLFDLSRVCLNDVIFKTYVHKYALLMPF